MIQAVVKQQNWTSGNSLVIIITGSGKRVAESYNGSSSAAALLHVEYATGPPPNTPPVVNAGADDTVAWGYVATLDATVTDDGLPVPPGVVTLWEQTGGPLNGASFVDATAIDTTVSFLTDGVYTLRLTADDSELSDFDEVTITVVINQPPTVSVAPVSPVTLPAGAVLDGTVTDDGLPAPVTIQWTGSGPGIVTFGNENAIDTTASFPTDGTYTLRLTATDVDLGDYFAEVTVIVNPAPPNQPPTVSVAPVSPVTLPAGAVLDGTVIDDGLPTPVTTQWTGSGPGFVTFGNENAVDTTASFSTDGTYVLRLTATDVDLGDYFAEVSITVNPAPPNWPPLAVDDPETTAINTAVTTDVLANDSDPEGDPIFLDSFDAASTQGGTVSRDEGGTPGSTGDDQLVYTPPTDFVGVDTYGYRVSDDKGGFATATVTVNVVAPDVIFERRVSTGNDDAEQSSSGSVNLSSSDLELVQESSTQTIGIRFQNVNVPPEATIVKAWVQFQADESDSGGTSLTFEAQASANPATFSSSSGNITSRPRLPETVSWSPPAWSTGSQGPAQQTPNLAPVIQAVVKQQNWTSGNSLVIIITGSGKRVAESYNGSSSAAALLHVEYATGPLPNTPPVVNAGGDQTVVQASVATATLDATVTDDGLPNPPASVTTLWEQTGGPTGGVATFTDANAIDTTVTFSISIFGTYTLRLTADDNEWQPFDEVMITVAVNQAPTVSVAAVPPVTLPAGAVLDGTVTDDGLPAPVTTQWTGSGPGIVTFGNDNAVDTTAGFSTDGTYTLRLTATDVDLGDYFAEVTVTVNPAPVPPTITSQPTNQTVTEPEPATFSVVATGEAPLTYQWRRNGADMPGEVSASVTLSSTTVGDSGDVFDVVVVSNAAGSVTSASATLTVNAAPQPPSITTQPTDQTVTAPAGATFSVVATGDNPLTYQWRRNGTDMPGEVSASVTLSSTTVGDSGDVFDVVVSNAVDTVTSASATLTVEVLPPPPPGPQTIFFDDLQQSEPFTLWVESNEFDWTVKAPEEKQVPGSASGNRVGHADNCDNGCFLTLAQPIDLSPYESATLSFWRYVDASLDSGEYLRVEISDGSAWTTIFEWTHGGGDDDQWHLESYVIPVTHLVSGFSLRFVSRSSSSREDNEIDDVLLEGMWLIGGNYRPVADAGSDQTVTDENGDGFETVTLDGSASSDPDGQIVDWEWAEGTNVLGNGESLDTDLVVGNHTVTLTVTDDGGATATDELLVRVFPLGGGDPTIFEVRVNTGYDDAEESSSGSVSRSSSDLELVQESSTQTVGIRFQGVDIPAGAMIVDAWVQFQADESHSGGTTLTIQAQDDVNPATFSSSSGNVSSRPRTTEAVSWSPPAWSTGAQGPAQQTPDLALVIQAVVDQQNWTSGNSLVIIITGSGKRVAESYNGSSSAAALLHVEYQ